MKSCDCSIQLKTPGRAQLRRGNGKWVGRSRRESCFFIHLPFYTVWISFNHVNSSSVWISFNHANSSSSFIYLFFLRQRSLLLPRLECSGVIRTHYSLDLLGSSNPSCSASQVAGTTGMHHRTWKMFVVFGKTAFCHVAQAGSWTPELKWSACLGLLKCWDYRREPPSLARAKF